MELALIFHLTQSHYTFRDLHNYWLCGKVDQRSGKLIPKTFPVGDEEEGGGCRQMRRGMGALCLWGFACTHTHAHICCGDTHTHTHTPPKIHTALKMTHSLTKHLLVHQRDLIPFSKYRIYLRSHTDDVLRCPVANTAGAEQLLTLQLLGLFYCQQTTGVETK